MQREPDIIFERQMGGSFLPRYRSAPTPAHKAPANRPLELLALEDRVLYSAAPLDLADSTASDPAAPGSIEQQINDLVQWTSLLGEPDLIDFNGSLVETASLNPDPAGSVLIVVDKGIENYQTLLEDVRSRLSAEHSLLLIDSASDGWLQLNQHLAQHQGIQQVHLFSHGAAGQLFLGNQTLELDDLLNDEAASVWQRALNPNADVFLYGCRLAEDAAGQGFVRQFALFSGADVAASTDQTGTVRGADWDLEFSVGVVTNQAEFAADQTWHWTGSLDPQTMNRAGVQELSAAERGSTSAVALNPDGSYVIVWSEQVAGNGWDVLARRFNADGTANGAAFTVNQTTSGDQQYASVDIDSSGRFVVTWTGSDGITNGILARLFAANGSALTNEFVVNTYQQSHQTNSSVSMAQDGRFVIAWQGNGAEDSQGIFAQRYNSSGVAVGSQIFVNSSAVGNQENPSVSMNSAGAFVVAWNDETSFRYQRFDSNGNKLDQNGLAAAEITVSSIGNASLGDILLNHDGTVVSTWQELNASLWDVFYRRDAIDGSALTGKTMVLSNETTHQQAPSIDGSGSGEFIISWEGQETGDLNGGVFYRLYNASGLANPYTLHANSNYTTNLQGSASVAATGLNNYVIVWSGHSANDTSDIGHNLVRNELPVAVNDSASVAEAGGVGNLGIGFFSPMNVLANDTDPGDSLSVVGVIPGIGGFSTSNIGSPVNGSYGTLTLQANGSVSYSLNELNPAVQALRTSSDTLTEIFTYTIRDSGFQVSNARITITITGNNDAPTAFGDAATAIEASGVNNGTPGTNPTGNVLTNDVDPDSGETLTVTGVAFGSLPITTGNVGLSVSGNYGSVVIGANGSYTYTVNNSHAAVQALRNSGQTLSEVFSYTVTDAAGLSSTSQLTVTIQGANDTPTVNSLSAPTIAENTPNGSTVATAAATEVDSGDSLTFTLSNNAGGRFAINSSTGEITVANSTLLNFESASSHSITIRVTDSAGAFNERNLTISLSDVNEFSIGAITDTNGLSNTVAENAANGTLVRITASATDADGSATVTYFLDDNAGGRFAINSSTGVVTKAGALDFETATSHNITVRAVSSDLSFSTATFTISVTDFSEFSATTPIDTNLGLNVVIENSAAGTLVGITAFSSDSDGSNNTITYSLTDSALGRFAIDASTGVVTLTALGVNFEQATSHNITVRATSSDGTSASQTFNINVLNGGNEINAIVDTNSAPDTLIENAALGSSVITAQTSHHDNLTITYSLFDNAGGRFTINSSTGVVSLASGLNFEAATSHSIIVRADAADGSFATQIFTINVTDFDEFDVGAVTDNNATANTIAENAANGAICQITARATDADGTTNTITYSLDNNAGGRFAINATTGVVTVANNTLLNFEAASSHVITVRATSADGSFSTGNFTITLSDVDEFNVGAISDSNGAANEVAENAATGTTVGITAFASDADGTTNTITYSLDNNAGGRFAINSSTGVVTVANGTLLNREAAASHNITVRATSADASFSTQSFTIQLTDVDEFDVGPISDSNGASNSVSENASNGTVVGLTASASDGDATTNTITYSLDDNAGGRFAINATTGVVTVANGTLLDREAAASHSIIIRATSADTSSRTQSFSISLSDLDEFNVGSITDNDATADGVTENASNGSVVGITAFASDPDATTNTITYSLDDNAGGRFAINGSTGVVTVANGSLLNLEAAPSHSITVRATSADGSSSVRAFTIHLSNQNESPTAVNDTGVAVEAGGAANATPGSNPSGNVLTNDTDPDSGDTRVVIGMAAGTPGSALGQVGISIAGQYGSLVLQSDGSYHFTLDNANPAVQALRTVGNTLTDTFTYTMTDAAGLQSTAQLSILITGANDHPTGQWSEAGLEINSGSSNNQYVLLNNFHQLLGGQNQFTLRISISTTQTEFYLFSYATSSDDNEFRIYAFDNTLRLSYDDWHWDTGINSSLVADGNRHELAVVRDSLTGGLKLFIDGSLAAQVSNFRTLTNLGTGGTATLAQEQDSNGGSFNSLQFFRGTIWDLSFYNTAWSNSRVASEAGSVVNAADLRGHWSFNSAAGGQITDHVGGRHGSLQSISGAGWTSGTPTIASSDWLNPISENPASGLRVGVLTASDFDLGDSFTWSLSDNAGGRFAINSSTGELTVLNSLLIDRENAASYQITAVATDLAGGTHSRTYLIGVKDVDEFDVSAISDGNAAVNQVAENSSAGTLVGLTAMAADADATTNAITFTLDNSAGGRFAIDSSTGAVRVANPALLNFESSTSHSITVRATSADGSFSTQSFTINVLDVNEFSVGPVSDINPATNGVNENASNGTTVGITANAVDSDGSNNAVTYSLDDSAGGRFSINTSTGVVAVANSTMLDRETSASHSITVRATSSDGTFSLQTFNIAVNDLDEFDVGPITDSNPAANSVAEQAANGTVVGITASASDPDATNNTVTWSLVDNAGGRFAIASDTGIVTVANGALLNRETAASHNITVRATSSDGSVSVSTFTVQIENVNESPLANPDLANAVEAGGLNNATSGLNPSGNVLANDGDIDLNDTRSVVGIQAGTHASTSGSIGNAVAGLYGSLVLNADGSYTYSVNNAHPAVEALRNSSNQLSDTFTYTIRDAGGLESTTQISFIIQGANDTPDSIWSETGLQLNAGPSNNQYLEIDNLGNLLSGTEFTLRLSFTTSQSAPSFLSYATTTEPDELRVSTENSNLTIYLRGQAWETGISRNSLADGERHEIGLVRDAANGSLKVFIDGVLRDETTGWMTGIQLGNAGSLVLGQEQSSSAGVFNANHHFQGTYWDLSVHSTAWTSGKVLLNSGHTFHDLPDLRAHWDFELSGGVTVFDQIGTRHGSLKSVPAGGPWIAGSPVTVRADWKPNLVENAANGTVVAQLSGSDIDSGEQLRWSLTDSAGGRFAIDASTGRITVADSSQLNFEHHRDHQIQVRVTDAGGLYREETYQIRLTDLQESSVSTPIDDNPAANLVLENSATGTVVGLTAWAIDQDGANNRITYSLDDNAGGRFAINADTGVVTVADGTLLNREAAASHQIIVRAESDDGTTATQVFVIQLGDANEFAIGSISDINTNANLIGENASAGALVGITALASDPDATHNPTRYRLEDDAGGRFRIDELTGVVTVAANGVLDYESFPSMTIIVRADSPDGSHALQAMVITLTDVDEFNTGALVDSDALDNLAFENSDVGTYTGLTAFAQDGDATQNRITYRLLDDDGGRFSIDASTGRVYTNAVLDFEIDGPQRTIRVAASSEDGSSSAADFTIDLANVYREVYTTFAGMDIDFTPTEILASDHDGGFVLSHLTLDNVPDLGVLKIVGPNGTRTITANDLSSLAIRPDERLLYVSPATTKVNLTLGYTAVNADGRERTGIVGFDIKAAAPPPPPSSPFTNNNSGSGSSSNSSSGGGDAPSDRPNPPNPEPPAGGTGGGDAANPAGAGTAGAVGPISGNRGGEGSTTGFSDNAEKAEAADDKSAGKAGGNADEQAATAADDSGLISNLVSLIQASGSESFASNAEQALLPRMFETAAAIEQKMTNSAQFGEYLSKLENTLQQAPIVVGFDMPAYASAGASLFTVGYVAWLIRGGVLLTSFMSSIPSWQSFDPLPIIENAGSGDGDPGADGSDSSIAELVDSEQPVPVMSGVSG